MENAGFAYLGVAFHIGPVPVHWYGILISGAFAVGIYLAHRETLRQQQNPDHLYNILLLLLPSVVVGARLYYVIFKWSWYAAHPAKIFAVWEGGLAIHGGIIAGILVALLYCRKKDQDFFRWADILMPSVALGQAIGRWGNFANVEAYGSAIEPGSFWSWVPLQVMVDGVAHHPTFLYESLWDLLVFAALMLLLRRRHRLGEIFASYLICYSVGRFFIESLRTDSLMLGPVRVAMLVSAAGVLTGVILLLWLRRRPLLDVSAAEKERQGKPKAESKAAEARPEPRTPRRPAAKSKKKK